jgi:pyruvate kinase
MKRNKFQRTKIVATVGPSCNTYEGLKALVHAGVDVFRLNFSHGTHEGHLAVIENIVRINEELGTHVSMLADLQGPKLRVGKFADTKIAIAPGDILTFTNDIAYKNACDKDHVYMSYELFAKDVQVGEKVLVDDGKVVLVVEETNKQDIAKLKVVHGNFLSSNKGVNLPDTQVSLPALTEKDIEDLDFILTQPVNWIALSFVRTPKDIEDLEVRIRAKNHPAKIIAKIEKPEAITNIKKIVKACNGIMVARGDLGVELPIEKVPAIQKEIIKLCIQRSRPVIVATQMLDSMTEAPSPTRAEVTDVANAVLDGADAVMLSGETASGAHPTLVVETMSNIISEVEKNDMYYESIQSKRPKTSPKSRTFISDVMCLNAARVAEELDAKGIVGMTTSGYTAFRVSSYRPNTNILIFSDKKHMLNTLNLVWGVRGFYYDRFSSTDETIQDVNNLLKEANVVKTGDIIVNTGSMPIEKRFRTNMVKVTEIE